MNLDFWKYHGAGNDFIIIDNWEKSITLSNDVIKNVCNRHFGIGSDGLILIQQHPTLDFEMIFYNPDASQSFCGNGSRCAVQFALDQKIIKKQNTRFQSTNGVYHAEEVEPNKIDLQMHDCSRFRIEKGRFFLDTGSPHLVFETSALYESPIIGRAKEIRYSEEYKEKGININFIEIINQTVHIRTYERGVENETLSCGTGVTAVALSRALAKNNHGFNKLHIETRGGRFYVQYHFDGDVFSQIHLIGPAKCIFKGEIYI